MSNDREPLHGDQSNNSPNGQGALDAELERLRERVRQLEAEREERLRAFAALERELERHRRAEFAVMKERMMRDWTPEKEEEFVRAIQRGEGLELKDFIGELERIALGI